MATGKKKKDFLQLENNRVNYFIHYETEMSYACRQGSDCCNNDYCRCGVITHAHVPTDVTNAYSVASGIARTKGLHRDLRFYCLERYISCLLRENDDCFNVVTGPGYYGEEVYYVGLDWDMVARINSFVSLTNKCKTKAQQRELVENILIEEYGYVLPVLKGKDWQYEAIPIKNIKPGNDSYRSINSNAVAQYGQTHFMSDTDYLSCLCKKIDGQYVLVDGYHRYAAANKRGDKKMMVLWCEV